MTEADKQHLKSGQLIRSYLGMSNKKTATCFSPTLRPDGSKSTGSQVTLSVNQ